MSIIGGIRSLKGLFDHLDAIFASPTHCRLHGLMLSWLVLASPSPTIQQGLASVLGMFVADIAYGYQIILVVTYLLTWYHLGWVMVLETVVENTMEMKMVEDMRAFEEAVRLGRRVGRARIFELWRKRIEGEGGSGQEVGEIPSKISVNPSTAAFSSVSGSDVLLRIESYGIVEGSECRTGSRDHHWGTESSFIATAEQVRGHWVVYWVRMAEKMAKQFPKQESHCGHANG
ncbi:MAG: hypothetical protein Q9202_002339 [Teloschistes flavicans]